jgi:hypothetical protein
MSTQSTNDQSPSISRAKRAFLLNLVLCALLGVGYIILRLGSSHEVVTPQLEQSPATPLRPQNAAMLASIEGQAHGLSEDPKAYLPLKKERLISAATEAIEQIKRQHTTTIDGDSDTLIAAYIDGYQTRFEDYYSDQDGYEAGFLFGLQFDPTRHPQISTRGICNKLELNKTMALEKYSLDEVHWVVFTDGFNKGYTAGYLQTKEGITAKGGGSFKGLEP